MKTTDDQLTRVLHAAVDELVTLLESIKTNPSSEHVHAEARLLVTIRQATLAIGEDMQSLR